LLRVDKVKGGAWFDAYDVQEAYNMMWKKHPINMNRNKKRVDGVINLLTILTSRGILDKKRKETRKEEGGVNGKPKTKSFYRVKDATIFRMILNPEATNEDGSPLLTHWTF
jgi:hypothetical protein